MATILVCYGGHFEPKMVAKIQKSSDLGEICFQHDSQTLGSNWVYPLTIVSVSWHYKIPTKRGGLYKVDLIIISLKNISYCNAERCKCPLNEQYKY
jgi:hypothetical protein